MTGSESDHRMMKFFEEHPQQMREFEAAWPPPEGIKR